MRNLKLTIEYDGANYCGWQRQGCRSSFVNRPSLKSIQGTIENALHKILREKVSLIASGRTDAGVHAQAQAANFKTNSKIPPPKLQLALNANLPDDITISSVKEVGPDFHSRFAAKSKIYRYTIFNAKYPAALLRNKAYFCSYSLNVNLMRSEARCLLGRHDFKSFCASGSGAKDSIRRIKKISIKRLRYPLSAIRYPLRKSPLIAIDIEADGFLYNMARSIIGTLIEIGRGRFKKGDLKKILLSRQRKLSGQTVPAKGLCLVKVKY